MSEEIFLEGKTYVSSKRAADQTGYAQDYIGQLARKGLVDAQRVGGLWYVHLDSLSSYQRNSASYTPVAPVSMQRDLDAVITFDGKDYISAARAAKLTGYNQDYIGQLARGGKILSRQIGNRWYVDRQMLLAHKAQKDSLLAAVQAESLGIARPAATEHVASPAAAHDEPLLRYVREDDRDLMPSLSSREPLHTIPEPTERSQHAPSPATSPVRAIPIRRVAPMPIVRPMTRHASAAAVPATSKVSRARKALRIATEAGVALTFVIVLSYGFSTLKSGSVYTVSHPKATLSHAQGTFTASAAEAFNTLLAKIEAWVAPQVEYQRN